MADTGNVLLDYELSAGATGASEVITRSNRMLKQLQRYLKSIRNIIKTSGKANVAAALGTPAATELEALYNRTVAFLEATGSELIIPPIEPE